MTESFGIMDDCYFVPRNEILKWVNNILDVFDFIKLFLFVL